MSIFERHIAELPAPDLIIHLGAGLCGELESWLKSGANRIVLVEPNPDLLPELRDRVGETETIQIIPMAVSDESGRKALTLFNVPMLSSLRTPTLLHEVLPSLAQLGSVMVETRSFDQFLVEMELSEKGDHWLVIDTPGEEAAILNRLSHTKCLHQFGRIFLTAGREEFYEGSESASVLAERLQNEGFDRVGEADISDVDWPCYQFVLNQRTSENQRLQQEPLTLEQDMVEAKNAREAELRSILSATDQQIAALKESSAAKIQSLESKLIEREDALRRECERAASEEETLHALQESARKSKETIQSLNEQLEHGKTALERAEQDSQSHLKRLAECQQQMERMRIENLELRKRESLLEQEIVRAEAQIKLIEELMLKESGL